jgi:hypothetical protein
MLRLERAFKGPEDLVSLSPAAAREPLVVDLDDPLAQMLLLYKNCTYVSELRRLIHQGRTPDPAPPVQLSHREEV